jgi:hypothetical protein
MDVDGELGLESGNNVDDRFTLSMPEGGLEKKRALNSGQQRRETKFSVKISGHFGARIINWTLLVTCPFAQSDAMSIYYSWGSFKGEVEVDHSQELFAGQSLQRPGRQSACDLHG